MFRTFVPACIGKSFRLDTHPYPLVMHYIFWTSSIIDRRSVLTLSGVSKNECLPRIAVRIKPSMQVGRESSLLVAASRDDMPASASEFFSYEEITFAAFSDFAAGAHDS